MSSPIKVGRLAAVVTTACAVSLAGGVAFGSAPVSSAKAATSVNLIRDPGAEGAQPNEDGTKVAVPDWAAKGQFTAVAYGTSGGFPTATSPGPKQRGHNFFAGGAYGSSTSAGQVDSLSADRALIRSGNAHYTLSGWLGGFGGQADYADVQVSWQAPSGAVLGTVRLGLVTAAQRNDVTGMRFRATSGAVPSSASKVLVTLLMVRMDGLYNDGYADNLSLTISK